MGGIVLVRKISLLAVAVTLGLLTSADAATSWRVARAPSVAGQTYGALDCVNASRCWVTLAAHGHPGVAASVDGGLTWRTESLPAPPGISVLSSLSCSSETNCVAVGESGNPETGSVGFIVDTHNGGATWRRAQPPTPFATPTRGVQLFSVSCSAGEHCVALGTGRLPPVTSGPTSCGPGCTMVPPPTNPNATGLVAASSVNGGATWTASVVSEPTLWQPNALTCEANSCHAVGFDFSHCLNNPHPCGATGAALTLGPGSTEWSSDPMPPGFFQIFGVSCVTFATCVAVGSSADSTLGHGVVARTTDGGRQWVMLTPPPTIALLSVSCASALHCVAAGAAGSASRLYGTILATSDGGRTWASEALPAGIGQIDDVSCAGGHCVATAAVGFASSMRGLIVVN